MCIMYIVGLREYSDTLLDPVASTPKVPASTENAFASTSSNQTVPDVEVVEGVEAIPHTFTGFSGEQKAMLWRLNAALACAKGGMDLWGSLLAISKLVARIALLR